MTKEADMKVTRRRLTPADRLKELDDAYVTRKARDDARVAEAEAALASAQADRTAHGIEYAEKRGAIVRAAKDAAAALLAQVDGTA